MALNFSITSPHLTSPRLANLRDLFCTPSLASFPPLLRPSRSTPKHMEAWRPPTRPRRNGRNLTSLTSARAQGPLFSSYRPANNHSTAPLAPPHGPELPAFKTNERPPLHRRLTLSPSVVPSLLDASPSPLPLDWIKRAVPSHRRDAGGLTAAGCFGPGYPHGFWRQSRTPTVPKW